MNSLVRIEFKLVKNRGWKDIRLKKRTIKNNFHLSRSLHIEDVISYIILTSRARVCVCRKSCLKFRQRVPSFHKNWDADRIATSLVLARNLRAKRKIFGPKDTRKRDRKYRYIYQIFLNGKTDERRRVRVTHVIYIRTALHIPSRWSLLLHLLSFFLSARELQAEVNAGVANLTPIRQRTGR